MVAGMCKAPFYGIAFMRGALEIAKSLGLPINIPSLKIGSR